MALGINFLRGPVDKCDLRNRGTVYTGRCPRTVDRDHNNLKVQPWAIALPECEGKLYKALGIESYLLMSIREGAPIGVLVREWDEVIDGPLPAIE